MVSQLHQLSSIVYGLGYAYAFIVHFIAHKHFAKLCKSCSKMFTKSRKPNYEKLKESIASESAPNNDVH